jgi:hypothetical protein
MDGRPQEICHVPHACEARLHDPTYHVPHDRLTAVEVDMRQYLIWRVRDTGADQSFAAVITYADLSSAIDPQQRYWSWSPPGYRGLRKALERISAFERAHGRPALSALVVHEDAHQADPSARTQVEQIARYWRTPNPGGPARPARPGAKRAENRPGPALDEFGLRMDDSDDHEAEDQQAAETLLRSLARVVEPEASHVESTEYERKAGTVTVRRGEAQLVARYRHTIPESMALRLAVGRTDLYVIEEGDLIEAKVSAGHRYVRQALGQLLDYAAHCPRPVSRLTALFPEAPEQSDVRLLHIYGIDCLYWAGGYQFSRLQAPAEARQRISASWSRPPAHA